jgi:hypothetical protein
MLNEKALKELRKKYDVEIVSGGYVDYIVDVDGDIIGNVILLEGGKKAIDADSVNYVEYDVDYDATRDAWAADEEEPKEIADAYLEDRFAIYFNGRNWLILEIE